MNTPAHEPDSLPSQPSLTPPVRSRRRLFGVLAAGVAAVGASFAAHGPAHAHGGRWRGFGGPVDAETMGRRIDAMVAYVLADVDATPDQKERIAGIAKSAARDLAPLRRQHHEARRQAMELLAAPTIDRQRFEVMRTSQMQLGETATRRASQALLDVAEVLTPQQRQQLAQKWQQRRHSRMG